MNHRRRAIGTSTKHRLDASEQLSGGERLDHVVVRPVVQAAHAVVLCPAGAEDDHRKHGMGLAKLGEQVEAVQLGQHEIEQHQIDAGAAGFGQSADTVGGLVGLITCHLERIDDAPPNGVLVLDDHDDPFSRHTFSLWRPRLGRKTLELPDRDWIAQSRRDGR